MEDKLPSSITWRRDKTGFEPPQQQWMESRAVQDLIVTARQKLVDEKILKPESLNKGVEPKAAHEHGNYDWRYLTASFLFK